MEKNSVTYKTAGLFVLMMIAVLLFCPVIYAQVPPKAKGVIPSNKQNDAGLNIKQLPGVISAKTFTPATLTDLCPKIKLAGNNDFERHKVYVTVQVTYTGYTSKRDSVIKAKIKLTGTEEEGSDRSKFEGSWEIPVYTAPTGYVINNLKGGDLATLFSFRADPARPGVIEDYGACKGPVFSIGKNTLGFTPRQTVISDIIISTDVNGDDFNGRPNVCNCGFKIKSISFTSRQVELKKL